MIEVAFDIGGTFTDFVLRDTETGRTDIWKVPTTSRQPAQAVLAGLGVRVKDGSLAPARIVRASHATTIATNAILERKGSRTALLTTAGFRDILLIGRQKRYDTNNLHIDKPKPLVERADIHEVAERVAADGTVLRALDDAEAAAAAEWVAAGGYESVAIVFLHSYANAAHEERMAAALRARLPGVRLSLSSVIAPKYREYERTSTTVANAYVAPMVDDYVSALASSLRELGVTAALSIMQSNGGVVTADLARAYPIRIVESGPAAGVLMCAELAREEGCQHVMTFDMGGTTAKLGAIDDGAPALTASFEVDAVNYKKGSGLPISAMAIDLLEIGAGGGSIARTKMGLIAVGPDSAGAEPGPTCYGHGGSLPTITDANVVLGYLNPDFFNGGAMALQRDAAAAAIERDIARPLRLTVEAAAWGIHSIANANMERAMRIVSIERGRDPRRYALVAFGGAGPLHACRLARALEVPRVIVPRGAGVGSALGLLVADKKVDLGMTRVLRLNEAAPEALAAIFARLEERVAAEVRRMDRGSELRLQRSASMRYAGQGYEIRVDLPDGTVGRDYVATALAAFHAAYRREYGYNDPTAVVEVSDWFVVATIAGSHLDVGFRFDSHDEGGDPVVGERDAYFPEAGGMVRAKIVNRYALTEGHRIWGPALVEERECTTVILPGDGVSVSAAGNLVIDIKDRSATA
ncbi:MAG: hydantoinase/oxoprolinase family protein [Acetobacteraceae bacterium]